MTSDLASIADRINQKELTKKDCEFIAAKFLNCAEDSLNLHVISCHIATTFEQDITDALAGQNNTSKVSKFLFGTLGVLIELFSDTITAELAGICNIKADEIV